MSRHTISNTGLSIGPLIINLCVDTNITAPPDTHRPGLEAAIAPDTDVPTAVPPADLGVISPLYRVLHTQPTVPVRFTRRDVGLHTV
jgi:hypothetical protein